MKTYKKLFIVLSMWILVPLISFAQNISLDTDGDGLSDEDETSIYFTDPNNPDTDGDGYNDGKEITNKYSPISKDKKLIDIDSDQDGLNDLWELAIGTNIKNPDTDGDGYNDGKEFFNSYNPLSSDEKIRPQKLIKVSLKDQYLKYYFNDKLIDGFKISSGIKKLPTPKGTFSVLEKVPTKLYKGSNYRYPNTKWNLRITKSGVFIHGAYWHKNFGKPMSHGCVNVSYDNMDDLYKFAEIKTKVVIE